MRTHLRTILLALSTVAFAVTVAIAAPASSTGGVNLADSTVCPTGTNWDNSLLGCR